MYLKAGHKLVRIWPILVRLPQIAGRVDTSKVPMHVRGMATATAALGHHGLHSRVGTGNTSLLRSECIVNPSHPSISHWPQGPRI